MTVGIDEMHVVNDMSRDENKEYFDRSGDSWGNILISKTDSKNRKEREEEKIEGNVN